MVIGDGLLAKAFSQFESDEKNLIFASGVSNSMETDEFEFEREKNLLRVSIENNLDKRIVYFSTTSILDPTVNYRQYVAHKIKMESIIRKSTERYSIFRVSNVVGNGGNPHTILNFIIDQIVSGKEIYLWKNATRNFLDVADLVEIVKIVLNNSPKNGTNNIANIESLNMFEVVTQIEVFMNKTAVIKLTEKGQPLAIDISEYLPVISDVLASKIKQENYFYRLLNKYYSNPLNHGLIPSHDNMDAHLGE